MKELIRRKFYPSNVHEEERVYELEDEISKTKGCFKTTVCREADYHYIEALFLVDVGIMGRTIFTLKGWK